MTLATLFVLWIAVALVASAIGHTKGRTTAGFVLGLGLGVIGVIIAASMEKTSQRVAAEAWERRRAAGLEMFDDASYESAADLTRPCPWCAELSKPAANVCRICVRDVKLQAIPLNVTSRQRAYQW